MKENKSEPKLLVSCLSILFNNANFIRSNFETSSVPLSLIVLHVDCSFLDTLFQNGTLVTKQDMLNAVSQLEERQMPVLNKVLSEYRRETKETVDYTELCMKALDPACPKPKFFHLFIKRGAKPPVSNVMQVLKPDELGEDACRYIWMNGDEQTRSMLIKDLVMVDKMMNLSWLTLEDLARAIPESHFKKEQERSDCASEGDEEQENDGDIPLVEVLAEATDDECDPKIPAANSEDKMEGKMECVDLSKLDGLPWEVECTVKFFKCLKNDKLPLRLRKAIVNRLYRLALGERSSKLSKEVGGGEGEGLLFECKLTKSARIIWEEAKQFSPRLTRGSSTPVYSEVIRVWDVAWNHDRLHHCIQNVKLSRKKSAESDIQLSLSKSSAVDQTKHVKYPRQFFPSNETSEVCERFVPAADIDENEYSVVSFYSVTSALVSSALADGNKRKDFPYKEWPKEHTIISLPQNRESILLLGRSGTGKTTCCLFRMWNQFRNFWESSVCSESSFVSSELLDSGKELTLHQVFISKNRRLCDCLKDKFYNMVASYKFLEPQMKFCKGEVPIHLDTVDEYAYPLFLSSKQFLILLDFSISAKPFFFPRRPDGSLKISVVTHKDTIDSVAVQSTEVMTEVTAECFKHKVWPKITALQQRSLDPLLVWMEIKSFIKGSHEAVRIANGYLSLPLYESLGSKMAPNYKGDRKEIYSLFIKYQQYLRNHCLFDECDLLHNLYQRLNKLDRLPKWSIDHFFVDEVQDFTQAELAILIRCCQNPNGLFMTGDTAQNIMSGVSFRFCDLRSLFHCLQNDQKKGEACSRIKISVPEIHHLDINFRSHSGILKLAASIIELMKRFFPLSFDVLPEDRGLFPGPQPIFIDSPESAALENDLENFLKSCERQSSGIQFGANQAIIVRSEDVKDSLQDKAIVLTVFESKGLEFDDVLLFNFFKDSNVSLQHFYMYVKVTMCVLITNRWMKRSGVLLQVTLTQSYQIVKDLKEHLGLLNLMSSCTSLLLQSSSVCTQQSQEPDVTSGSTTQTLQGTVPLLITGSEKAW